MSLLSKCSINKHGGLFSSQPFLRKLHHVLIYCSTNTAQYRHTNKHTYTHTLHQCYMQDAHTHWRQTLCNTWKHTHTHTTLNCVTCTFCEDNLWHLQLRSFTVYTMCLWKEPLTVGNGEEGFLSLSLLVELVLVWKDKRVYWSESKRMHVR